MKRSITFLFLLAAMCVGAAAQSIPNSSTDTSATPDSKPKRVVFRVTKDQIAAVQLMLKDKNLYTGDSSGRYNPDTRKGIKLFQKDNGLKQTGALNRATLEKMGIVLTDSQKAIPVSSDSFATASSTRDASEKPQRGLIFRATKDQIREAQQKLKDGNMYSGEQTGQLNKETRDGLKKFQEEKGLKVTGTLNQITLEKMGITLTEKQKADSAAAQAAN